MGDGGGAGKGGHKQFWGSLTRVLEVLTILERRHTKFPPFKRVA